MAVKEYSYNDKTQLTPHFKVSEMRCNCGKKHNILVDKDLFDVLEKAREILNAKSCILYSGHRCSEYDKKVGGSGKGYHTKGQAVDCYFTGQDGKKISGDIVCCVLEDLGHKKGIGIRCGGSQVYQGKVHIDVGNRKWYGNEAYSFSKSIQDTKAISDGKTGHKDFLSYCFTPIEYVTIAKGGLNVRNINHKVIDTLKYGTKIKVYYILDGMAKIDINKYVSIDYIVPKSNFEIVHKEEIIEENIFDKVRKILLKLIDLLSNK